MCWLQLAEDTIQHKALLNTVMNLQVPWRTSAFSSTLLHAVHWNTATLSYLLVMPSAEISCILQHADTILMASWSTTSTRHSMPCPGFLLCLIASFIISEKHRCHYYMNTHWKTWNYQKRDNSSSKIYSSKFSVFDLTNQQFCQCNFSAADHRMQDTYLNRGEFL